MKRIVKPLTAVLCLYIGFWLILITAHNVASSSDIYVQLPDIVILGVLLWLVTQVYKWISKD